jgi:hypothetical protein
LKKLVAILMIMLSGSVMAQMKLEYKPSAPLHYKAHASLKTTQTVMEQVSSFSILSDQFMSVESKRSDDELVYSITIDSSENYAILPNGDTNAIASPLVGKIKETRIYPDGEEISSRWLDTAFAQTQAGQMREFGSIFFELPAKAVQTGDTWHQDKADTVGIPGGNGKIIVDTGTDYKLVGEEEVEGIPCAKIEFTGKVKMNGSADIQGMDMTINGKGSITGSALFDYTDGKVVKIDGASEQDFTMASSGENAMTIPMSQKTEYNLTLFR